ncbi:MAG: hypothetical protein ACYCV4_16500, partial [Dermatophilaceae bacterium]
MITMSPTAAAMPHAAAAMSPTATAMSPTAAAMSPTAAAMSEASVELSHPSDEAPTATVVALIAHARGVPSIAREAFAAKCHALQGNDSVIIVHTCHRVEMYAALGSFADGELP